MATTSPSSCANGVAVPASGSTGRWRNLRRLTARKTATASDPDDNADDDATDGDAAAADDDDPADTYAAANDAAISSDYRRHADDAVAADGSDGDDDGDDCDDADDSDGDCTVVGDEDANVVAAAVSVGTVVAEDGREPLPLLIRAPPPRDLLAVRLLPKQVRGPVREVEESEYDWEEDPWDNVDALGPRRELGQPRPAAVFFPWLHMYFALPQFIHRHGILRVSDERLLKEFGRYWSISYWHCFSLFPQLKQFWFSPFCRIRETNSVILF